MSIRGKHLTPEERAKLEEAILTSASIKEAAERTGIDRSTVARHLNRLRKEGRVGLVGLPTGKEAPPPEPASPVEVRDVNFWRRKAKAAMDQTAEAQHALQEMAGIFQRDLNIPDWVVPAGGARRKAIGLIHLSDLHVGEVVRPEEIGGFNAYDPEIFKRRFRRMISASVEILPRWAADCDMHGVVLALNGDLISGDIHDELRRTNALTSHEQVALATDEIAAAIHNLADSFGSVMVTVTPGNHGRSTEKTHAKRMAALSYDIMIGNILAREFAKDDRVVVNLSSGPDMLFPLFGWSVLQTHGDSMGTGGGQGFAGPELPIVRGGKKVRLSGFAVGERYDIMLTAHYHTSSNPGTMLANGSMVGYSEYAQRIRGVPEPPMQWLALVHEKWGLRERVPVVLEDPSPPARPRVRVPASMN